MGPASNIHFRNNLFMGDGWADPVFNLRTYTNYSSSDYNGFYLNPGATASFEWSSPPFDEVMPLGEAMLRFCASRIRAFRGS